MDSVGECDCQFLSLIYKLLEWNLLVVDFSSELENS